MAASSFAEKVKTELVRKPFTSGQKTSKIDDKRARLRDAFLRGGTMSDPAKSYHLEFVSEDEQEADEIRALLSDFAIRSGRTRRKGRAVVYIKDGEDIAALLNVIGAHVSLMEVENLRIYKEMRGAVNRRVNCDAANIAKAVNAASAQMDAIRYLEETGAMRRLPKTLRDAAAARKAAPEATLQEIAARMKPPMTKSGMNHRLQKLVETARQMKEGSNGEESGSDQ